MNEKEAIEKIQAIIEFIDDKRAQLEEELAISVKEDSNLWIALIAQLDELSIKITQES
jgi:hypothetical protein